MKRSLLLSIALSLATVLFAESRPWTANDVATSAKRKSKVIVQGTVTRAINFDVFVLSDGKEEMLLDATGVRQRLGVGDVVVASGRYMGRSDRYPGARVEIVAAEVAVAGTPEATALAARAEPLPTAATPTSVENRLRALDDLKSKDLVTDEEYRQQRQKILNDL